MKTMLYLCDKLGADIRTLTRIRRMLACALLLLVLAPTSRGLAVEHDDSFALNLTDADINVFIETVSEITGHNFVIDPRVKGKVTVITSTPTSANNIYEIFLSALQVNGFVAVPSGKVVKIVPDAGANQRAPQVDRPQGGDELVTRILQVDNVSAKQLVASLKPLLPPTAYLSGHPEAKMIVVADSATNVERVARIVRQIDRASGQEIEIIQLEHSDAEQLVDTLRVLEQTRMQRSQSQGGSLASMVADRRANSILLSGPPGERARMRALIVRSDVPTESTGSARVIYLKHAVAGDLQEVLKGIGEKLLKAKAKTAKRFDIQADKATNALIVSASPDLLREMKSLIDQLDIPRQQVQVEGIIAEISTDRGTELGVEWQSAFSDDGFGAISRSAISGSTTSSIGSGTASTGAFPGTAGSGLSLGYFSSGNLRALLSALASDSSNKILSTPTVVTLDNKQALIHVGQNVPIVTGTFTNDSGSQDPFQTIERRDVGIKLQVTPQINEGNTVRLEIRQEVSNVDQATDGSGLITNERTIETTVQVDDGQIIALGGLISDDVSEQHSGIPFVSDIPVIGEVLGARRSTLERRNLVVFLRPTILDRPGKRTAMVEQRYRRMRELQMSASGTGEAISLMPGERAATLPPYPPPPEKPMIELPDESAGDSRSATPASDDELNREYSFFNI